MRRLRLIFIAVILASQLLPAGAQAAEGREVLVTKVDGVIDGVLARHVRRAIEEAREGGFEALVIELDTPGGLDTAMREIVQAILASEVPVIVYVSPPGARAASAGVFIAYAAHVSAMAPGTNIGAASPVALDPGGEGASDTLMAKATNDAVAYLRSLADLRARNADWAEQAVREAVSVRAEGAEELGVVDLLAGDLRELLERIDGTGVQVKSGPRTLRTSEGATTRSDMNPIDGILHKLANPNIAFILLSLATTALLIELINPGLILPGVAGVIMLLFALVALGTLPIEPVGIALIAFAVFLFILETLVTSSGVLAVGGVIALVLGGLFLFQPIGGDAPDVIRPVIEVSRIVLASVGGALAALVLLFFYLARFGRPTPYRSPAASDQLIGRQVRVTKRLDPVGEVHAAGEFWRAQAPPGRPARKGSRVVVRGLEGVTLKVEPEPEDSKGT